MTAAEAPGYTVGVDLAAAPRSTAVCTIAWTEDAAVVESVRLGADDADVLGACADAERIGIDCPFGWPEGFVAALVAHQAGQPWPGRGAPGTGYRRTLCYRATDVQVRERTGRMPLSVSTDRIGVTAMRCAALLDDLGPVDRAGTGRVLETYPAAALRVWGLWRTGYKTSVESLAAMVDELGRALPGLRFADGLESLHRRDHNVFDALVCALVAQAAQRGRTIPPDAPQRRLAEVEGWIHLPAAASLAWCVGLEPSVADVSAGDLHTSSTAHETPRRRPPNGGTQC